jgi:hypothetical protein
MPGSPVEGDPEQIVIGIAQALSSRNNRKSGTFAESALRLRQCFLPPYGQETGMHKW